MTGIESGHTLLTGQYVVNTKKQAEEVGGSVAVLSYSKIAATLFSRDHLWDEL